MIGMVNLANMNLRAVVPLIANILRAIGFVVLCIGVYKLVRIYAVSTTPLSPTLVDDGFAADGYIIVALFLELAALILTAFRSHIGRIVLAISSVTFLEGAFLWIVNLPLTYPLLSTPYDGVVFIAMVLRNDSGPGLFLGFIHVSQFLDFVCLAALVIAFLSVFLLSKGSRLLAFLNSTTLASFLLLELSTIVYFIDRSSFNVHFTDSAPVWLTNYVLGVSSALVLASVIVTEVYLRRTHQP